MATLNASDRISVAGRREYLIVWETIDGRRVSVKWRAASIDELQDAVRLGLTGTPTYAIGAPSFFEVES